MVSQKITDYIEQTRKEGYSDNQIRESLKKTGWNLNQIDQVLNKPKKALPSLPLPNVKEESKTNSLAIIALIFTFLFAPAGLILGIIALKDINKHKEKGKGLAIAAIVISIIILLGIILLIPVTILILFGVADPSGLIPEACQFPAGIDCIDKASITKDTITIALRNNIGSPITIDNVVTNGCTGVEREVGNSGQFTTLSNIEIPNNQVFRLKLTGCNNGNPGEQISKEIVVEYTNIETSLPNEVIGEIRGKIS